MNLEELKSEIRRLATLSGTLKKDTETQLGDEIASLALQLEAANPTHDPTARTDLFDGRWRLLFSTFNLERKASLAKLSFSKLPDAEVTIGDVFQEVSSVHDQLYDNVVEFEDAAGQKGLKVMHGQYTVHDGHRLDVVFDHVFVAPRDARNLGQFRSDLGLDSKAAISVPIPRTPPLHSSIVFLDNDMRINRGVYGGVYVLERLADVATPSRTLNRVEV
jgi:PAP_fibrillin